jgi:two-component system, NarL family, invasion response regulator UvrY
MHDAGPGDPAGAGLGEQSPVRVLVVDDQASFRAVMRELVAATRGFTLAGEAASGEEALDAVDQLAPHMVIMDKRMPGMGGIEAARVLTTRHPEVVVLIVSVEEPDPAVIQSSGAAFARKEGLSTGLLREVWDAHRR